MGEYSWVVQSDKFWTLRKHILDCSKTFLESVIKACVPRGVYSLLLVPPSLGPRQTWVGGTNRGRIRPGQKGNGEGGGATKKRRGQGRRVAVTEHWSNGVSRVATMTKHPSTTHGGSTRRQQGQHGDKKGRGWAEETLLLLLVLHGTCLGQSPSQVGRNDEDSSHHEMMQCPAPPTPSFSPDPLGRHRPRVCSCAQELLDSH